MNISGEELVWFLTQKIISMSLILTFNLALIWLMNLWAKDFNPLMEELSRCWFSLERFEFLEWNNKPQYHELHSEKIVTSLLANRDHPIPFHGNFTGSVLRAQYVFSAGSPGEWENRHKPLLPELLLSVPILRHFRCGALNLPATSASSQDTSLPQRTEQV